MTFDSADLLAGLHNLELDDPGYELEVFPNDVILHAQYNRVTQLNDITLVRTNRRPITFNPSIQILPLLPRSLGSSDLSGIVGRIAGW